MTDKSKRIIYSDDSEDNQGGEPFSKVTEAASKLLCKVEDNSD